MNRTHVFLLCTLCCILGLCPACSKTEKFEEASKPTPCPTQPVAPAADEATQKIPSATPAAAIMEAKTPQEFEKLFTQGKPMILKVSATWCGPCRYMAPLFEKEAVKYCGRAIFVTIDADNAAMQEAISKYAPRGFPTFSYFDKTGKLIRDHPGAYQPDEFALEIKTFVEKYS